MSGLTFSLYDQRRSGVQLAFLVGTEKPPWWTGASVYEPRHDATHPQVKLKFVGLELYDGLKEARYDWVTVHEKAWSSVYATSVPPTLIDKTKAYLSKLQVVGEKIEERATLYEEEVARMTVPGESVPGWVDTQRVDAALMRAQLQRMRWEQGMLIYNLGLCQGREAYSRQFEHTEFYSITETQHRFELTAGVFHFLENDPCSEAPEFCTSLHRDHLAVLKHIFLAQSKEPELLYAQQEGKSWQLEHSHKLCNYVLGEYIKAHHLLLEPNWCKFHADKSDVIKRRAQLSNFVQLKILFHKASRQYTAAFMPQYADKKKHLRRKAFAHYEDMLKLAKFGNQNRQSLRDEAKMFMYQVTVLVNQNRQLSDEAKKAEQDHIELLELSAQTVESIDPQEISMVLSLADDGLLERLDIFSVPEPKPALPDWLVEFVESTVALRSEAKLTPKDKSMVTLPENFGRQVAETRESDFYSKQEARELHESLAFEIVTPDEDLYHKSPPVGVNVHATTSVAKISTKVDLHEHTAEIGLAIGLDCFKSGDGLGTLGNTKWVRDMMRNVLNQASELDEKDQIGVIQFHKHYDTSPYKCPMYPGTKEGLTKISDYMINMESTGGHYLVSGLIEAYKALKENPALVESKEIILITDGADSGNREEAKKNWQDWQVLKAMIKEHSRDSDRRIIIHIFCLGDYVDKYLKFLCETITQECGGDFATCNNDTDGIGILKDWVLKRISNQFSKVATNCTLHITCEKGVKLCGIDKLDIYNAEHTLISSKHMPIGSLNKIETDSKKTFRNSKSSIAAGRSFRNSTTKKQGTTEYKDLAGNIVFVDDTDIKLYVVPIQRLWRSYKARKVFAELVDKRMSEIDDEAEKAERLGRLKRIAARQVNRKPAVKYDENDEYKRTTLSLDLQDFSSGDETHIPMIFETKTDIVDRAATLLAVARVDYKDCRGKILNSLTRPVVLRSTDRLYSRSTHSWLSCAQIMDATGEISAKASSVSQYEANATYTLKSGDWVEIGDSLTIGKESKCTLLMVDGTRLWIEENTQIVFQAYSALSNHFEFWMPEGQIFMLNAPESSSIVECPVMLDDSHATFLVPPTYRMISGSLGATKITYRSDRLNVNSVSSGCQITFQSKETDVPPLMQTVAREAKFPAQAWTIEEEDYQNWLSRAPWFQAQVTVQANVVRSVMASALEKVAIKLKKNIKLKKSSDLGHKRCREIIILHYLFEIRRYITGSISQLTTSSQTFLKFYHRAQRIATEPPECELMSSYATLHSTALCLKKERSWGNCPLYATPKQQNTMKRVESKRVKLDTEDEQLKSAADAESARRKGEVEELFPLWDLDGSGFVEFPELQQVILCWAYSTKRDNRRFLQKWELALSQSAVGVRLEQEDLQQLILYLTDDYEADMFNLMLGHIRHFLERLGDLTESTRVARALWNLFQCWDIDGLGYVDSEELFDLIQRVNPWSDLETVVRLRAFLHANSLEVIELVNEDSTGGHSMGRPVMLPAFHSAITAAAPQDCSEDTFHEGIWLIKQDIDKYRPTVNASGMWKAALSGGEMQHLLTWDMRHCFDGLKPKDVTRFLDPKKEPPVHIKELVVVPIMQLCGIKPARELLFPGEEYNEEDWWGALKAQIADGKSSQFLDFLMTFPVMSVSKKLALKIIPMANVPEFDRMVVLPYGRLLSAICEWAKLTIKIVVLMNNWRFDDGPKVIGGENKGPKAKTPFSVLNGMEKQNKNHLAIVARSPKSPKSPSTVGDSGDGIHNVEESTTVHVAPRKYEVMTQVTALRSQLPAMPAILPSSGFGEAKLQQSPKVQAMLPRRHGPLYHPCISPRGIRQLGRVSGPVMQELSTLREANHLVVDEAGREEALPMQRPSKYVHKRKSDANSFHIVESAYSPKISSPRHPRGAPRPGSGRIPPLPSSPRTKSGNGMSLAASINRAAPSPPITPNGTNGNPRHGLATGSFNPEIRRLAEEMNAMVDTPQHSQDTKHNEIGLDELMG